MSIAEGTIASTGAASSNSPAPKKNPNRQIILLSDGTGNSAAAVWRTNVWRVFESLDLTDPSRVALYDDGVGSSSFKPLAVLGGVFGFGLKRNVVHLYSFLCRNYRKPGVVDTPEIYMFGFSRGAFTIRVLIGLIDSQGLVPSHSERQLARDARAAYRAYRADRYTKNVFINVLRRAWHRALERVKPAHHKYNRAELHDKPKPKIHFVGLWDTVAAYGLPIDEMTRGVDMWLWPLELPDRKFRESRINWARHAISLDDERTTFHPVLWTEKDHPSAEPRPDGFRYIADEKLSQVWFSGVHANVGGGYPDDSLACVPLYWIMAEAQRLGLQLKKDPPAQPDALKRALSAGDRDGRLYDSRAGLSGYYRYGPRKMVDLCHVRYSDNADDEVWIKEPKIHYSVFERIKNGAHAYAPLVLPQRYAVVDESGRILDQKSNPYETADFATTRAATDPASPHGPQQYWGAVRCQRCLAFYATFIALLFALASMLSQIALHEGWGKGIASVLSSPWHALSAHPYWVGGGLLILVACGFASFRLAGRASGHLPAPPTGSQEDIWNLVWHRRMAYFATLGFSTYLAVFPLIHQAEHEGLSSQWSFLSPVIRLVGAVLPGFASFWINSFAANPGWFAVGAGGVGLMLWRGAWVAARITDEMRKIWTDILIAKSAPSGPNLKSWIYRLRTDECYRSMLWALKRNILPSAFALMFVYLGFAAIVRPIFTVADSLGYVCPKEGAGSDMFRTDDLCWRSVKDLKANTRYTITLTIVDAWKDGPIDTDLGGYGVKDMTFWKYLTWPLRRSLAQPWFKPIARIGYRGGDEYVLQPARPVGKDVLKRELVAEITARTDGRLFLYVNDAVGLPFSFFYGGRYLGGYVGGYANLGTAKLDIQEVVSAAPINMPAK